MKKMLVTIALTVGLLNTLPSVAQEITAQQPTSAVPTAASPPPKPDWMNYHTPYVDDGTAAANPNRTTDEIKLWAQETAAEILSFGPENYRDKLNDYKKYFVTEGWQPYATYLQNTKLLSMVTEGGYTVGTIVSDTPDIVSQGANSGVYHWIVRIPITLSFFKTDPATGETKTGASGKYILFIDVMRVTANSTNDVSNSSVAINNWRVDDIPK